MSFVLGFNGNDDSLYILKKKLYPKRGETLFIRNAESEDKVYTFQYIDEIITEFEIPTTGVYKIEAWGASGGGTNTAPKGAYSMSFVSLSEGERIRILVGEKGYDGYETGGNQVYCSGGGGGSFVVKGETPLCIAGGGGGHGRLSINTIQPYACGQSGQYGGDPQSRQVGLTYGGLASSQYSGGGGGFRYNGGNPRYNGKGGNSFINGGRRQTASAYSGYSYGGFGGGGSTHGNCGGSGGGGGYTGGGGSENEGPQGGGGGSFFTGFYNGMNSTAISGCDSFPTKPTQDLNGNVVLTLMINNPEVNKCRTCSCRSFQIQSWVLFSILISS
jgi:hypothetical protein